MFFLLKSFLPPIWIRDNQATLNQQPSDIILSGFLPLLRTETGNEMCLSLLSGWPEGPEVIILSYSIWHRAIIVSGLLSCCWGQEELGQHSPSVLEICIILVWFLKCVFFCFFWYLSFLSKHTIHLLHIYLEDYF